MKAGQLHGTDNRCYWWVQTMDLTEEEVSQKISTATGRSRVDHKLGEWPNQRWASTFGAANYLIRTPIQLHPFVCSNADIISSLLWKISMQWHGGIMITCHFIGQILIWGV